MRRRDLLLLIIAAVPGVPLLADSLSCRSKIRRGTAEFMDMCNEELEAVTRYIQAALGTPDEEFLEVYQRHVRNAKTGDTETLEAFAERLRKESGGA